jgi:hypothetical protein
MRGRATRAMHEFFSKIYEIPRASVARELCAKFLSFKYTVCSCTKFLKYIQLCVHTHTKNLAPTLGTAFTSNDEAGRLDCDSRRALGPIRRTIRGLYMTQLNRLQRLAVLSARNEWSFYA